MGMGMGEGEGEMMSTQQKETHLLCLDDMKLIGKTEEELPETDASS